MAFLARQSLLTRLRAGGVHLLVTATLMAAVIALVLLFWYPKGLFEAAGGLHIFLIVAAADVSIGPLLTTLVYVPGKKGLAGDLVTIAVLQLAALGYGVHTLHLGRPVFVVFVADRFELVRAKDLDENRWKDRPHAFAGVSIVGTKLPDDPARRNELVIASMSGLDLQHFPEYYVPYDRVTPYVRNVSRPLAELRRLNPGQEGRVDRAVEAAGRPESALAFVPVRTGGADAVALVDARSGELLRFAGLRPWE